MHIRNSLWNIAGGGIPGLAAIICLPLIFSLGGSDLFSLTSLLISLSIFFYVFDAGMARTMTFQIASAGSENHEIHNELIKNGLVVAILFGLILTIPVYVAAEFLAVRWLDVDLSIQPDVERAFQIASFGILPSVVSHVFRGALEGRFKFKNANICKLISGSTIFVAPLLLINAGNTEIVDLSFSIVLTRYIALLIYIVFSGPYSKSSNAKMSIGKSFQVWAYAKWAALSGFISTAFVYADRFFVAGYINASELSIYIGSQDILIRYLLVPWSISQALMPAFSASKREFSLLNNLYYQTQRKIGALSIILLPLVLLAAYFLLKGDFFSDELPDQAFKVVAIQLIGVFFCALSQLPLMTLYAMNKPKLVSSIFVVELLIYLVLAPLIFNEFGLLGASTVWTTRLVLEFFLLNYLSRRLRT